MTNTRLIFDNISLIPVYRPGIYPFCQDKYRDMWHVPGRTMMSTDALVDLATRRGFAASIVEQSGIYTTTTRLN